MKSIRFCIDSVESNDEKTQVVISGWACDEKNKKVEIEALNKKIINRDVIERYDIYHHFNEANNALNSGFVITVPYDKKIKLRFFTEDEDIVCKVTSKGEYKANTLSDKIGRFLTIIYPQNIVKIIRQIKDYGLIYTLRKIKNILFPHRIKNIQYKDWIIKNRVKDSELSLQRKHKFNDEVKIYLVVLVNESNVESLSSTMESISKQTYKNVEVALVSENIIDKNALLGIIKKFKHDICFAEIENDINKVIRNAKGDYISTVLSGDILELNALYEVVNYINENRRVDFVYSDEDTVDEMGRKFSNPHFKPDWSPDLLNSYNYIGHLAFIRKEIINFDYKIRNEYELYLLASESTSNIGHISKVLYHSKDKGVNNIFKTKNTDLDKVIISQHIDRMHEKGIVENGLIEGTYKVNYEIKGNPLVSIIIPNKDEKESLKKCIDSIIEKSTYSNYEIIVVENNSVSDEIFDYYKEIEKLEKVKVITWKEGFNYSAINNFAFKHTKGEFVVLLNNDIEIITSNWIEEMLMYTQRKDVGITGVKLYYPDDSIQHAGVIIGLNSVAGHSHGRFDRVDDGYAGRLKVVQNLSAVTAACLMIKRSIFKEINGLDEKYPVAFNDVDFCLRVRQKGYLIIFNPFIEMYHYESKSRGIEDSPEKVKRFNNEVKRFKEMWGLWKRDPYYNDNLTKEREDFSLRI